MDGIREHVAYLRGLAEGIDARQAGRQGQLLVGLLDAFQELVEFAEQTDEDLRDLEYYVEEVDEAVWELEGHTEDELLIDDELALDDELVEWEITCPSCSERVYYIDDDDDDVVEVLCPVCGETLWDVERGFPSAANLEEEERGETKPLVTTEHGTTRREPQLPSRND